MHHSSMVRSTLVSILVAASSAVVYGAVPAKSAYPVSPTLADLSKVLIFEEPLVTFSNPSKKEIQTLAKALDAYLATGGLDDLSPVKSYLNANPTSPWQLSLLVNLGLMHRHNGQISQALDAWESAWILGKDLKDPKAVAFARRALGELVELNAGLGRKERLEDLFKEAETRSLAGLVTEKLAGAKESLILMRTSPNRAYRCGPLALTQIKAMDAPRAFADPRFEGMDSTAMGTTLAMNVHRAQDNGMKLQMAKRAPGGVVLTSSVVHWKAGHFSALVTEANDKYLIQDPSLGDTWVSKKTLDEEFTGYALVAAGTLPAGWSPVMEQEGQTVWGRGAWGPGRPDDTRKDSHKVPEQGATPFDMPGIPVHRFHTNLVSLNVETNLVNYTPAKGPRVEFTVTYNQREYGQPQLFDYCNLGPKWTFTYLACLKDDTTNPNFNVTVCYPGGGGLVFRSKGDGTYAPEDLTQAVLTKTSPASYAIRYINGRVENYALADRAVGLRRIVLTKISDKDGNDLNLTWDMNLRLVAIKDAEGKTTNLAYENPKDILKLTKITDPFGKTSRLGYNPQGYLVSLVNAAGKESTFTYGPTKDNPSAPEDFLNAITTPEGTTAFAMGEAMKPLNVVRWLEAKLPNGQTERLEGGSEFGAVLKNDLIPAIPELDPGSLAFRFGFRNSFYWGAGTSGADQKDYAKAVNYQWGHGPGGFASGILITEKKPGENRTFYVHAGDFWGGVHPVIKTKTNPGKTLTPMFEGGRNLVTRRARVLPGGKMEVAVFEYDSEGHLLRSMDPASVPGASTVKVSQSLPAVAQP